MSEYQTFISTLTILPKGDPIFSEKATRVSLDDEAAGLFVTVSQDADSGNGLGKIQIMVEEWPQIREAIESMLAVCEENNGWNA